MKMRAGKSDNRIYRLCWYTSKTFAPSNLQNLCLTLPSIDIYIYIQSLLIRFPYSRYLDDNIRTHIRNPRPNLKDNEEFIESNKMHCEDDTQKAHKEKKYKNKIS